MSNIDGIFFKKWLWESINLGDHFMLETFFSSVTLLLKSSPNSSTDLTFIDRIVFLPVCWFVAKNLAFRTHHLWNSTTELILNWISKVYLKGKIRKYILTPYLKIRCKNKNDNMIIFRVKRSVMSSFWKKNTIILYYDSII